VNAPAAEAVSEGGILAFERDGVVPLRQVFGREWLELVGRGIERELAHPGPGFVEQQSVDEPGRFVTDYCPAQRIPELQEFVLRSPAAELAGRVMRSSTAGFLMDVLWIKEPGTAKPSRWHHDQPYFCVDGRQMCSIWLPVDPVPADVSLAFVAGSHRWGRLFRPRLTRFQQDLYRYDEVDARAYEDMPDIDAERDKHRILSWALEPGDCVVFHALTLHGAPGNPSATRRRRVLTTVWFGDDAIYGVRPSPPRPHFRGHALEPGDPMRSELFPRLWPRPAGVNPRALGAARFSAATALRFSI